MKGALIARTAEASYLPGVVVGVGLARKTAGGIHRLAECEEPTRRPRQRRGLWCIALLAVGLVLLSSLPAAADPTVYHVRTAMPYREHLIEHEVPRTERILEARAGYVFRALRVARRQRQLRRARCLDRKLQQLNATRMLLDDMDMPDEIDSNWLRQIRARLDILEARSREILRASYACSWANRPKTIVTVRAFQLRRSPIRPPRR